MGVKSAGRASDVKTMKATSASAARTAERRRDLRYPRRLEVELQGFTVHTANVSRSGMQLVCPDLQLPSLQRTLAKRAFQACIKLVEGSRIVCDCEVAYQSPCEDELLVGVRMTAFGKGHQQRWHQYIDGLRGPTVE
jgi:hypothetical protein